MLSNGAYDLPNFILIFAVAIILGILPTALIVWLMLRKKVTRHKFDESKEK